MELKQGRAYSTYTDEPRKSEFVVLKLCNKKMKAGDRGVMMDGVWIGTDYTGTRCDITPEFIETEVDISTVPGGIEWFNKYFDGTPENPKLEIDTQFGFYI